MINEMSKFEPPKCPFFLSAYANAEHPHHIFGNTTLESPELPLFLHELLPKEFLLHQILHPTDQN